MSRSSRTRFFFLLLPSAVVILGAFKGTTGGFTLEEHLGDVIHTPQYIDAFQTSIEISAVTALLGGASG